LVFVLFVLFSSGSALGDPGARVVSSSHFVDAIGYLNVVGEVENTGTESLERTLVDATFYDSQDGVVATGFNYIFLPVLEPGEISPFVIRYLQISKVPLIESYVLEVSWEGTGDVPSDVTISTSTMYTDPISLRVIGEVKNNEDTCQSYFYVAATLYNESGVVIDMASAYTPIYLVEPGGVTPFAIDFIDQFRYPMAESYSVVVWAEPAFNCPYTGSEGLNFVSHSYSVDDHGRSRVIGEVENFGNQTADNIMVTASAFNDQGQLIGVAKATGNPDAIDPGARSSFEVIFYDEDQVPGIHHYTLDLGTWTLINTVPQNLLPAFIGIMALAIFSSRKHF